MLCLDNLFFLSISLSSLECIWIVISCAFIRLFVFVSPLCSIFPVLLFLFINVRLPKISVSVYFSFIFKCLGTTTYILVIVWRYLSRLPYAEFPNVYLHGSVTSLLIAQFMYTVTWCYKTVACSVYIYIYIYIDMDIVFIIAYVCLFKYI